MIRLLFTLSSIVAFLYVTVFRIILPAMLHVHAVLAGLH